MASEYTTNRRYPLYTDQDKPNLRDQYNGAIRMIDGDMDDALDASGHVSDALGAGFDAQHTVRMAIDDADAKFGSGVTASNTVTAQLNGKASQAALTNEATARQDADASLSNRLGNGITEQNTVTAQLATKASAAELQAVADRIEIPERSCSYVLFSDSFGSGIYVQNGSVIYDNNGWRVQLKRLLESMGNTVYQSPGVQVGNAGFTSTDPYDVELQALAGRLSQEQRDAVRHIIVLAGTNDRNATAVSIDQAVQSFIGVAHSQFRNAHIKIGYLASRIHRNVISGYRTACGRFAKCEYIDGLQYMFLSPSMMCEDNTHPSPTAYETQLPTIIRGIFGKPSYSYIVDSVIPLPNGFSHSYPNNPLTLRAIISPTSIEYVCGQINPAGVSGFTLPDDTAFFASGSQITISLDATTLVRHIPDPPVPLAEVMQRTGFSYYPYMGCVYITASDNVMHINRRTLPVPDHLAEPQLYMSSKNYIEIV